MYLSGIQNIDFLCHRQQASQDYKTINWESEFFLQLILFIKGTSSGCIAPYCF